MTQTGYPHGRPGYVVDHIIPLKRGGADAPWNMQWQTITDSQEIGAAERTWRGRPIGADRDRAEEPDAPPPGHEIGTDQLAVYLRREAGDVLGREPAIDIVEVGPEILRIGCAEKRPEGGAEDAPSSRQIALGQRSNCGAQLSPNNSRWADARRTGYPGSPARRNASPSAAILSGFT